MNTVSITAERLGVALDQIKPTDGALWETFANTFLASEFPQLRPVGGMHDEGRDAFLYEPDGEPGVYIQHSTQETFETKIRNTLQTLQNNGFQPKQLIYCSPRDIIKESDDIKRELRLKGVSLDLRDRTYFLTFRNQSAGRLAASEDLAKKLVDPLLKGAVATASIPHALTEKEERTAIAYFQISVRDRASDKSVSKLCYEALVRYALREATPENPLPLQKIIEAIGLLVVSGNREHVEDKVKGSVARLSARGVVKHQTHPAKTDGYTLSNVERTILQQQLQKLISEVANLLSETGDIASRVAEANEIDYPFDAHHVAKDVLMLCDYFLLDMGRSAAKAFESKEFFNPATTTLSDYASRLTKSGVALSSLDSLGLARFLDLVPQTAEAILKKPSEAAAEYLSRVADSYYLLFALRQSTEVMQAVGKVVGTSKILLDASTLVPCMAEILLPEDERRVTGLFKSAIESGVKLYVSQEAIDELHAVIRKARAIYASDQATGFHFSSSGLVEAFQAHSSQWGAGLLDFLNQFAGVDTPDEDLKLFLKHHLSVEFLSFENERAAIDKVVLEEIAARLKPTRRPKEMEEAATDRLVCNDVTCLLLIEKLRKAEDTTDLYGFSWWWLTSDRAAYALDRSHRSPKACVCMSPDFLLRYLSIQPLPTKTYVGAARHLPLAVEVAAVGLIPLEIKTEVETELAAAEKLPKYMRIRRIRDLLYQAKSPHES
jgi:hypothetical protein